MTNVDAGGYILKLTVNPEGEASTIAPRESNYGNNSVEVPVSIQ